jgi:hypothetical protein
VELPGIVVAERGEHGFDDGIGPTIDRRADDFAGIRQSLAGEGEKWRLRQCIGDHEVVMSWRLNLSAGARQLIGEELGATFGGQEGMHRAIR